MSRGIRAYTNIAVHQSPIERAGSESVEESLLSLPSPLESIHPTDIMKQSITSTIRPTFSQNSSSSVLTKWIYVLNTPGTHDPHVSHWDYSCNTDEWRMYHVHFSHFLQSLYGFLCSHANPIDFLIDLLKSDRLILYLPIYRNIFIYTGLWTSVYLIFIKKLTSEIIAQNRINTRRSIVYNEYLKMNKWHKFLCCYVTCNLFTWNIIFIISLQRFPTIYF